MRTKEEYYQSILLNRELAADPAVTKCPCTATLCEWHGRCRECVAIHRHHGNHVPACLQPLLKEKLGALAAAAELRTVEKEKTTDEYRLYVRARDKGLASEE